MTKFYFFRTVRIDGFMKLRPLAGQTTYTDRSHQDDPVHTDWNVQCSSEDRGIQCSLPEGTIFGALVRGARNMDTKLHVYTRNDVKFYRVEGSRIYPICDARGRIVECNAVETPQELRDAYVQSYSGASASAAAPATEAAPSSSESSSSNSVQSDLGSLAVIGAASTARLAKLNEDEINDMSAYVEGDIRAGLKKLSKLRDFMAVGVAKFTYRKQNGDLRTAFGTRNPVVINTQPAPASEERERDGAHFAYYDIQRHDWRCFCVHDFLDIDESFLVVDFGKIAAIAQTNPS